MTPRLVRAGALALVLAAFVTVRPGSSVASAAAAGVALPARLADTGLYDPAAPGVISTANRRFSPQYPLWSDGMTKRRWIYLPPGSAIDASVETAWEFPVGTRFWKEFSLQGRKVETRLLWKASPAGWLFASYVWNADGTEARLAPEAGVPDAVEVAAGRRHSIPSRSDCSACHGTTRSGPIGFNVLQLSDDRDPGAIHGEPLGPGMLTLSGLVAEGLLSPAPRHFVETPPRIRTAQPVTRTVLGYLAANCGTCHNGSAEVSVAGPSLTLADLLADGDRVARSLIARPSRWQVPGASADSSVLVHPGSPELSTLFLRLRSRAPSSQMPPLGTVLRDQAAVEAVGRWIARDLVPAH